ncbi:MAG: DUF2218 domain-containing protein [Paracoccaceae bacterium]|jgi:hypothetical protein
MLVSTAYYPTENASKYIQQLCKHFAHKVEAGYADNRGHAALPPGPAEMIADPAGLTVRVSAPDLKGIIQARFAIDSHLVTFAHREGFSGLTWMLETPPANTA